MKLPIEPYNVEGYKFGERLRRHLVLWARHLGDDVIADAGTQVVAIEDGKVVWSEIRRGSREKRNWGGIVVIEHTCKMNEEKFYALYGHLNDLEVKMGDVVTEGQKIGVVAGSYTPENGWWKIPHLHFAIYLGPWKGTILPGYWRVERFWQTRLMWWGDPREFIAEHNKLARR